MNNKAKAFSLFDEGKTSSSPEVKALKLKGSTRYTYYDTWKKERGMSPNSKVTPAERKLKSKVINELEMVDLSPEDKKEELEEGEVEEGEKHEGKGDGKKGPPIMVAGQGLTFAITISTKTLALYQIAASGQDGDLTLGDFIDTCVEDTYRGRGLDIGLVKLAAGGK